MLVYRGRGVGELGIRDIGRVGALRTRDWGRNAARGLNMVVI